MSNHQYIRSAKLVLSGVIAAIITLLSFLCVQLPSAGFIHFGDAIIFVAVYVLGGWHAVFAAAIGSTLADTFLGYVIYAPATFIIKGLTALVAFELSKLFSRRKRIIAYAIAAVIVPAGYFIYEAIFFDISIAVPNIVYNIIQMAVSVPVGFALTKLIDRISKNDLH